MTASPTVSPRVLVRDPSIQRLVDYTGLNQGHLHLLQAAAGDLADLHDTITSRFYDHVLAQPELTRIIDRNSSVERLRGTLVRYVDTLWSGDYDDATVAHRVTIGKVHDRIQLPLGAYLGAFTQIDLVVSARLIERHAHTPEQLADLLAAWRTLTQTDMAIVAQSFIDARDHRLSSLLETLSATSQEVAAQTNEARQSVDSCARATETGTKSVTDAWNAVELMNAAIGQVHGCVEQFSVQLKEIEEIVTTIDSISGQTKLLSLNARIEAARAGDHGRGFAVVAQEVGVLAARTAESLKAIGEHNATSTSTLAEVDVALAAAVAEVAHVQTATTQAREGFTEADAAVTAVAAMIAEIEGGMESIVRQATSDMRA